MGLVTKVTCDGCGLDLTTTGNCEDWRLVLTYEAKTPWYVAEGQRGGAVTSMAIEPPIKRTYYFCGLECLDQWRDHEHIINKLWKAFHDGWREKYGSKFDNYGSVVWSSPGVPEWLHDQAKVMFKAEADEQFPLDRNKDKA
jgi:hypothetical protein